MTNRTNSHRFAGTAIAAFLALSSTSIGAQETPAPVDAPVTQPAPTIVLPPVTAAPPAPAPVVEAAPAVEPAPPLRARAAAPARSARTAPARTASPVAASAAPQAAAPEAIEAAPPPVVAEVLPPVGPVTTAAPVEPDGSNNLLLAGLAGALGLGAIGLFAATRRRRRIEPEGAIVPYEPVAASAEPVAVSQPEPAALVSPAFTPMARWSEPHAPLARPAESRALDLNRAALLKRMVAAEPDANNPFTSGKARRRRARLMLQSLESDRWDDAELAPGFDWREMAQAVEERETVQT